MAYGASTQPAPFNLNYPAGVAFPTQVITTSGAITIPCGIVELTEAGASAVTLALPDQNGLILAVSSKTAQTHTLTVASGLHGLGAGEDVGTFSGAIDDCVILASVGGYWVQVGNVGVTFA